MELSWTVVTGMSAADRQSASGTSVHPAPDAGSGEVDRACDATAVLARGGAVLGWTADARQLRGYAADEVVGRSAAFLLRSDPAAVAEARALASRQLRYWELEELTTTTELVVSELVTNAIRHAAGPVRLRLLRSP
jgi:hypothetical protein